MSEALNSKEISAQITSPIVRDIPTSLLNRSHFVKGLGRELAARIFEHDTRPDGYIRPGIIEEARVENDARLFADRSTYRLIFETYLNGLTLEATMLHAFLQEVLAMERAHDQEEFRKIAKAEEEGYTFFTFSYSATMDIDTGLILNESSNEGELQKGKFWITTRDYDKNATLLLPLATVLSKEVHEVMSDE